MLRTGLVVSLVLLLAAGCGGSARRGSSPPKLPHALAAQWAAEADSIAAAAQAGQGCHAQALAQTLAQQVAQDSGRVPGRLQTPLLASVTALAGRIPCVQVVVPQGPPGHDKPPKKHDHGPHHGGGGD